MLNMEVCMGLCYIIAPRQHDIVGHRDDDYLAECIRVRNHDGPHLILTPEGEYFTWEDDWECDCCDALTDEPCYDFGQISAEEAELLKGRV